MLLPCLEPVWSERGKCDNLWIGSGKVPSSPEVHFASSKLRTFFFKKILLNFDGFD